MFSLRNRVNKVLAEGLALLSPLPTDTSLIFEPSPNSKKWRFTANFPVSLTFVLSLLCSDPRQSGGHVYLLLSVSRAPGISVLLDLLLLGLPLRVPAFLLQVDYTTTILLSSGMYMLQLR